MTELDNHIKYYFSILENVLKSVHSTVLYHTKKTLEKNNDKKLDEKLFEVISLMIIGFGVYFVYFLILKIMFSSNKIGAYVYNNSQPIDSTEILNKVSSDLIFTTLN